MMLFEGGTENDLGHAEQIRPCFARHGRDIMSTYLVLYIFLYWIGS